MPIRLGLILFALWAAPEACRADVYKYVDGSGTESFTDNLASIPEKYRDRAVLVRKDPAASNSEGPDSAGSDSDNARVAEDMPVKRGWSDIVREKLIENQNFYKTSAFRVLAAVAMFLAGFYAMGKAGAYLGMRQIATILRVALTAGLLLYLFSCHLEGMVSSFTELKGQAEGIKEQAEKRNEKTDKAVEGMFGPSPVRK